jgi:hypothetical protein
MVAVECGVESLTKGCECAYFFKAGNCHEDAKEEEDGAHVDATKQIVYALAEGVFFASLLV